MHAVCGILNRKGRETPCGAEITGLRHPLGFPAVFRILSAGGLFQQSTTQ
jgi:hypothetical protein